MSHSQCCYPISFSLTQPRWCSPLPFLLWIFWSTFPAFELTLLHYYVVCCTRNFRTTLRLSMLMLLQHSATRPIALHLLGVLWKKVRNIICIIFACFSVPMVNKGKMTVCSHFLSMRAILLCNSEHMQFSHRWQGGRAEAERRFSFSVRVVILLIVCVLCHFTLKQCVIACCGLVFLSCFLLTYLEKSPLRVFKQPPQANWCTLRCVHF